MSQGTDNANKYIEFRALPPNAPYKVIYNENKMIVHDNTNPYSIINGEYVAKSSSDTKAIRVFDNKKYSEWHRNGNKKERHTIVQRFITTTITGEQIEGDWIEIQMPYKLNVTRYTILTPKRGSTNIFPKKFTLLGSNDGIRWTILDKQDIPGNPQEKYNIYKPVEFIISNYVPQVTTFRIVFERPLHGRNNNLMNISEIQIYGYTRINLAGQPDNFQTYSNNNMHISEGLSVMQNEQQLLNDLNEFNTKYARYVACSDNILNANNKLKCTDIELNKKTVTDAYDKIVGDSVSGSLYAVKDGISDANDYITNDVADATFDDITAKHNNIMQLRGELDAKLKELYVTEDSLAYEQKRIFDGTVYTSLIWTVLATTTLFYVFKKL
jgi:hypothetical protein